ncbi:MAG: hypothetical protein IPJ07_09530 [Acidobacteria bacterium]|nr:hypothetical protein [Acidobacteriota bacterium]
MNEVGLLYQPRVMGITRTALTASLLNLRSYVESRKDLWHTVINQSSITQEDRRGDRRTGIRQGMIFSMHLRRFRDS